MARTIAGTSEAASGDKYSLDSPLATGRSTTADFGAGDFSHKRQVGIPLAVNTIRGGRLHTLLTRSARGDICVGAIVANVVQRCAATAPFDAVDGSSAGIAMCHVAVC